MKKNFKSRKLGLTPNVSAYFGNYDIAWLLLENGCIPNYFDFYENKKLK